MKRKLIVIGFLASAMAVAGTAFIISQLPLTPGPQFKYLSWPIYIRVVLVSVAIWVAIGSVFIRKQTGLWSGVLVGLLSPAVGVVAVNPFFIFVLGEAPLQFAGIGLVTGILVWLVARSQNRWLREVG